MKPYILFASQLLVTFSLSFRNRISQIIFNIDLCKNYNEANLPKEFKTLFFFNQALFEMKAMRWQVQVS